jgi:peptidoglycan/LPS O-acetylase OafA/YrhL
VTGAPAAPIKQRAELPALTGVRFLAASYVVAYHFGQTPLADAPGPIRSFVGNGYVGVSFFFVLSGFILAYTYGPSPIHTRRFFESRFARIYPLYAFAWLLSAPAGAVHRFTSDAPAVALAKFAVGAISALSLCQTWVMNATGALNPPAWSLSVEAFFYAVFPFLLPRLLRCSRAGLLQTIAASWALSALGPLLYAAANWRHPERCTPYFSSYAIEFVKTFPVFHLPQFVVGVAFGCLFLRRGRSPGGGASGWASLALSFSAIVLLSIAFCRFYLLVHNGLLAPIFGALLYALATKAGVVARVFSTSWFVFLGRASYGIYILQAPIWSFFLAALAHAPPASPAVTFALGSVTLGLASALAFKLVEEPGRVEILRRFQGPK